MKHGANQSFSEICFQIVIGIFKIFSKNTSICAFYKGIFEKPETNVKK
jgi:hypothetical protein